MKRGMRILALAIALALTVSYMPVNAAPKNSTSYSSAFSLKSWWGSIWDKITGNEDNGGTDADSDAEAEDGTDLTLVEDESTVEEGTMLRASTYALAAGTPSAQANTTMLKYFPVTLYDYDTTTINDATHQVEVNNGLGSTWNGIYFSNGSPAAESYTYSTTGGYTYSSTTVNYSNNNNYSTYTNGSYYVDVNGTKYVVTNITCTRTSSGWWGSSYTYSWTITYNGGSTTSSNSSITLYTRKASNTTTTSKLSYAAWNWWNKNTNSNNNGQYTYSGLVNSTLDANKNISFTKPDGGIFNSDAAVKSIYTNVDMPFVYENGTYTFDASQNGVYFSANSSQGSTAAQSNGRLYFNEGKPQSNGGSYGDGSSTVWMPFNSTQSISGESNCNYHFGMAATIPFTMTANGKMNQNDENSEDITFSFSGDDDVWVFIDGQLVLDIGGIHNRLDATINFAENTWSLSKSNTVNVAVADYNGAAISGKLFNDDNGTGTLNQTRETFAATDSHELTIFYLERGAGSSNCKIQFNLPMKDTVSVTKRATQSIASDGTVSPLTAAEQAVVDNIDFGFTLTKNGTPVANTNYNLMNANGQVISTPSTDANGHFTLRNGQTARFVGEIATNGAEYQVVEDAVEAKGFKLPTYTYGGTAAGGFAVSSTSYTKGSDIPSTTQNLTSAAVTAKGSDEAEDSLSFVCENYFDANLPNPSSRPVDDQIVVDYGLPVVIDVLANDVYRGDSIEITDVTGAQYGTATIENGKITYQLTKQLTGVEVLTYTAKVTGSGNSGSTTTTDSESNTAKVYIIPATSMYYEENFSDLVTFTDSWSDVGTAQIDPQEPGVVGTVGDSPYGSDAAYLNDGGDSNGSSKYVDTTSGAAQFSYTFTGTGTSFFARTSGTAAYMKVVITDKDGNTVYNGYRNNIYKSVEGTDVGTLYNVPVFTYEADNYGAYTVTVSIAKPNENLKYGKDFYLDGIRVINPLDSSDANASIANAAYATDGEANMTVATLREKLIGEAQLNEDNTISWNEGDNFVLFTDSNGAITAAEEYRSNGPKEEVYLNNGQSVTFSLKDWDANTNKIYLGIKAPLGSGSVSINGNTLNLSNAADCYYEISNYANITTGEEGVKIATFEIKATSSLVSVTNIKVTGNAEFVIVNQEDITVDADDDDTDISELSEAAAASVVLEDSEAAAVSGVPEESKAGEEETENPEGSENTEGEGVE
ncbi:MAG: fibro-slime domain-containing protein [Eubacteriales bacterium]|nr:fibro-slime domain-containing protein [Eubacteriales bacterium]